MSIARSPLQPLAAALLLAFADASASALIDVNIGGDSHVSGHCTLREAIVASNTHAQPVDTNCWPGSDGGNTIAIPPGFAPIELSGAPLDIADTGGETTIRSTITGARVAIMRVAGSGSVFTASHPLTLEDISISGGNGGDNAGGGISTGGTTVTLRRCIVSGNRSTYFGGGIFVANGGSIVLVDSSVSDNSTGAIGIGGGIAADDASTIVLTGSTISDNASGDGGGIFVWQGHVSLDNSTVSGNTAVSSGGGIATYQLDSFQVTQSTIAGNAAPQGAGIRLYSRPATGSVMVAQLSLFAGNTGSPDIEHLGGADDTIAGTHNLIDQIGEHIAYPLGTLRCDPQLLPLADNGGLTRTHALRADSCALDAGGTYAWTPYDQRGDGHPRFVGIAVDIGAYEREPLDADRIFANGFE